MHRQFVCVKTVLYLSKKVRKHTHCCMYACMHASKLLISAFFLLKTYAHAFRDLQIPPIHVYTYIQTDISCRSDISCRHTDTIIHVYTYIKTDISWTCTAILIIFTYCCMYFNTLVLKIVGSRFANFDYYDYYENGSRSVYKVVSHKDCAKIAQRLHKDCTKIAQASIYIYIEYKNMNTDTHTIIYRLISCVISATKITQASIYIYIEYTNVYTDTGIHINIMFT
jgi:hypothetical protein